MDVPDEGPTGNCLLVNRVQAHHSLGDLVFFRESDVLELDEAQAMTPLPEDKALAGGGLYQAACVQDLSLDDYLPVEGESGGKVDLIEEARVPPGPGQTLTIIHPEKAVLRWRALWVPDVEVGIVAGAILLNEFFEGGPVYRPTGKDTDGIAGSVVNLKLF